VDVAQEKEFRQVMSGPEEEVNVLGSNGSKIDNSYPKEAVYKLDKVGKSQVARTVELLTHKERRPQR
jgi:hypothetical protein